MLNVTIGILFGFIAGTYLTYYLVPKIFLPLPMVFFALFILFPETPQYFIQRKNFEVKYIHHSYSNKNKSQNKRKCCCAICAFIEIKSLSLFLFIELLLVLHAASPAAIESKIFVKFLPGLLLQRTNTLHANRYRICRNSTIGAWTFESKWTISQKRIQKPL